MGSYREANMKRWKKVPKEQRSAIMRERALQRQAKMSASEKRRHALMMVEARKGK